jgi:hypothetical protein
MAASDDKGETTNWHAEVLAFLKGLKASGKLADWNQVAFLFRSVKNDKVVALAHFLETEGVPVFSPRSNMFFEREEIRLMIGALIFLFPQFPKVRGWAEGVTLPIWDYYDQLCFKPFTDELRKPENKPLLDWARPLAKRHAVLTQNTDYAFSGLFYQLLQFPLFSRFLTEEAVQGVDKGRAARNLGTFSKLLTKFEYLHYTAFSRAQNLLVLAAQEKQGRGKSPSKYFERLFYALPSWRAIDLTALTFEAVKQINLKREYRQPLRVCQAKSPRGNGGRFRPGGSCPPHSCPAPSGWQLC